VYDAAAKKKRGSRKKHSRKHSRKGSRKRHSRKHALSYSAQQGSAVPEKMSVGYLIKNYA
jgi:hypothetical protein